MREAKVVRVFEAPTEQIRRALSPSVSDELYSSQGKVVRWGLRRVGNFDKRLWGFTQKIYETIENKAPKSRIAHFRGTFTMRRSLEIHLPKREGKARKFVRSHKALETVYAKAVEPVGKKAKKIGNRVHKGLVTISLIPFPLVLPIPRPPFVSFPLPLVLLPVSQIATIVGVNIPNTLRAIVTVHPLKAAMYGFLTALDVVVPAGFSNTYFYEMYSRSRSFAKQAAQMQLMQDTLQNYPDSPLAQKVRGIFERTVEKYSYDTPQQLVAYLAVQKAQAVLAHDQSLSTYAMLQEHIREIASQQKEKGTGHLPERAYRKFDLWRQKLTLRTKILPTVRDLIRSQQKVDTISSLITLAKEVFKE